MPYAPNKMRLTKCFTKMYELDQMFTYFVLVYKSPAAKWVSVDLIIAVYVSDKFVHYK